MPEPESVLNRKVFKASDEVIEALRATFENKETLLDFLREEIGVKISRTVSYTDIIDVVIKQGKESEFCHKIFKTKSFQEAASRLELWRGLVILSKEELTRLADVASNFQKKWKYDQTSRKTLLLSIIDNASKDEINQSLQNLIQHKDLPPVRQYMDSVVGSLGITRSICKRKPTESEELIRLLVRLVDHRVYPEFVKAAEFIPREATIDKDEPLLLEKFFQLLLTYADDLEIIQTFNTLLEKNQLAIEEIQQYNDIVVTPCGIFKREYGDVENLAEVLRDQFDEQELRRLLGEGAYVSKITELQVLETCIKEKPDQILDNWFGLADLWKIAEKLNLVSFEKIGKKELIKVILLRLGFSLPVEMEGIEAYAKTLQSHQMKLEGAQIDSEQKTGIMVDIFKKTESILKDLIYFYCAFFWEDEVEKFFYPEEKKNALDNRIRRAFEIQKDVSDMNLGPLISLLRQIESWLQKDSQTRGLMEKEFKRPNLLLKEHFDILNQTSPFRPLFEHNVKRKKKEVDVETCRQIVEKLLMFAKDLKEKEVYPEIIRITREVTDEYGRTYLQAIDEGGKDWLIKSASWLQPRFAYFMHSQTDPVAVQPFTVAKFW